MLELKESNCPFWLIGFNKGYKRIKSLTNEPEYNNTRKKQYQHAATMLKNNPNLDEIYLISGIVWDHINNSWSDKELIAYIKNKGELIISNNDITKYELKYDIKRYIEHEYPKGVSRDPLPKNGVKTYTSVATNLESKENNKMLELKLNENMIDEKSIIDELYNCTDDKCIINTLNKLKSINVELHSDLLYKFADLKYDNVPTDKIGAELAKYANLDNSFELELNVQDEAAPVIAVGAKAAGIIATIGASLGMISANWDIIDKIIDKLVELDDVKNEKFKKSIKDLIDISKQFKDKLKECETNTEEVKEEISDVLKESKIVNPVGNPQTAGSFVNIDVDLDHMEVSDFIVRLAQSIRSEQNSVLEYVALRSSNGVTNEDRLVIDGIIEEEKNHMVALSTLLYKQLLVNHKQNVNGANKEFALPKFGMDLFDKEDKLTESVSNLINSIVKKEFLDMENNHEFYVGDRESGDMYFGIDSALSVIKNKLVTSDEEVVARNVSLIRENKLENVFNSVEDLIKELETDTNYDEIACHINDYSKKDKQVALSLMDKLFELEKSKNPKECVEELIKFLKEKHNITEEVDIVDSNVNKDGESYVINVDVEYDVEDEYQIANRVVLGVEKYNKKHESEGYCIENPQVSNLIFNFTIKVMTENIEIDTNFVQALCKELFELSSDMQYIITLQ